MPEERVQRALARAGFGSRRACEELIVDGRVTVNGTVATLGRPRRPGRTTRSRSTGSTVNLDPNVRYYALHKPPGVVTTMNDPQGRPDIRRFLPEEGPRVFPVGRLDRDSEGLLLLTNDGELGNRLMHPRFGDREGVPGRGRGRPRRDKQLARLRARGGARRRAGQADLGPRRRPRAGARGAVRLVMTEGRKREVRRMLAEVGLPVRAAGPAARRAREAGATWHPARVRELTHEEIRALARPPACSLRSGAPGRRGGNTSMKVRAARGAIVVAAGRRRRPCSDATERLLGELLRAQRVEPRRPHQHPVHGHRRPPLRVPGRGRAPDGPGPRAADVRARDPGRGVDAVAWSGS